MARPPPITHSPGDRTPPSSGCSPLLSLSLSPPPQRLKPKSKSTTYPHQNINTLLFFHHLPRFTPSRFFERTFSSLLSLCQHLVVDLPTSKYSRIILFYSKWLLRYVSPIISVCASPSHPAHRPPRKDPFPSNARTSPCTASLCRAWEINALLIIFASSSFLLKHPANSSPA